MLGKRKHEPDNSDPNVTRLKSLIETMETSWSVDQKKENPFFYFFLGRSTHKKSSSLPSTVSRFGTTVHEFMTSINLIKDETTPVIEIYKSALDKNDGSDLAKHIQNFETSMHNLKQSWNPIFSSFENLTTDTIIDLRRLHAQHSKHLNQTEEKKPQTSLEQYELTRKQLAEKNLNKERANKEQKQMKEQTEAYEFVEESIKYFQAWNKLANFSQRIGDLLVEGDHVFQKDFFPKQGANMYGFDVKKFLQEATGLSSQNPWKNLPIGLPVLIKTHAFSLLFHLFCQSFLLPDASNVSFPLLITELPKLKVDLKEQSVAGFEMDTPLCYPPGTKIMKTWEGFDLVSELEMTDVKLISQDVFTWYHVDREVAKENIDAAYKNVLYYISDTTEEKVHVSRLLHGIQSFPFYRLNAYLYQLEDIIDPKNFLFTTILESANRFTLNYYVHNLPIYQAKGQPLCPSAITFEKQNTKVNMDHKSALFFLFSYKLHHLFNTEAKKTKLD